MKSLVSVIIPTYNRASLIGETLDSVMAQTYPHWECIIVDDGSTDNTEEIVHMYLEKDDRFQYHKRPADRLKGANACRNYGFELSKGEYVNWFDSDDIMMENFLEKKVEALRSCDYSICEGRSFITDQSGDRKLGNINTIQFDDPYEDFILTKYFILTGGPLWRKDFLMQQNLNFDETLSQSQDYDFHYRVLKKSTDFSVVNEYLYLFRNSRESISQNFFTSQSRYGEAFLCVRKNILEENTSNKRVVAGILSMIASFFRRSLDHKDYKSCKKCLVIFKQYLPVAYLHGTLLYWKFSIIYHIVTFLGRGGHFFRNYLRLAAA